MAGSKIPDIAIFTHRWHPDVENCIRSVATHTKSNYNLILVCEPGNCHENMQRAIERSTSRFLVFLDEDVTILQDGWLDRLTEVALLHDDIALVGAAETTHPKAPSYCGPELIQQLWLPAYTLLIDREKLPDVHADLSIPWIKGKTDLDIGLQAITAGFNCVTNMSVVVRHGQRNEQHDSFYLERDLPTPAEIDAHNEEQMHYIKVKWAPFWSSIQAKNDLIVEAGGGKRCQI